MMARLAAGQTPSTTVPGHAARSAFSPRPLSPQMGLQAGVLLTRSARVGLWDTLWPWSFVGFSALATVKESGGGCGQGASERGDRCRKPHDRGYGPHQPQTGTVGLGGDDRIGPHAQSTGRSTISWGVETIPRRPFGITIKARVNGTDGIPAREIGPPEPAQMGTRRRRGKYLIVFFWAWSEAGWRSHPDGLATGFTPTPLS